MAVQLGSERSPGGTSLGSPCMSCGSRVWASFLLAQLSGPLGERVGKACSAWYTWTPTEPVGGSELQDLWKKYMECGDMLSEAQEDAKTLHQQAPVSTGCVSHYTHIVPLVRTPCPQPFLPVSPVSPPCWLISILSPFLCLEVLGRRVQWGSSVPPPVLRCLSWFPRVPG